VGKGVLWKANTSVWNKTIAKKFNTTTMSDGKVRHADTTTWYDNYPMEEVSHQDFDVVWTQAYNASGVKLDAATWGDHPRSGDSIGFIGLFGFDNTAMKNYVAGGVVQAVKVLVKLIDPSHAGNPDVRFGAHIYTSKPASASWASINQSYIKQEKFYQTGGDIERWVELPSTAWILGDMGGIAIWSPANTAANSARFAGKTTSNGVNSYVSKLHLQVLK